MKAKALVGALANTQPEVEAETVIDTLLKGKAETLIDTMAEVITKTLVDALANKVAENKAKTLIDTKLKEKAKTLFNTLANTLANIKNRDIKQHTGRCKGQGTNRCSREAARESNRKTDLDETGALVDALADTPGEKETETLRDTHLKKTAKTFYDAQANTFAVDTKQFTDRSDFRGTSQ